MVAHTFLQTENDCSGKPIVEDHITIIRRHHYEHKQKKNKINTMIKNDNYKQPTLGLRMWKWQTNNTTNEIESTKIMTTQIDNKSLSIFPVRVISLMWIGWKAKKKQTKYLVCVATVV